MSISLIGLLYCESSLPIQLVLLACHAVFWHLFSKYVSKNAFEPWIRAKPWKEQWTEMWDRTMKTAYGINLPNLDTTFEVVCYMMAGLCQHGVGGALCLPSVLGFSGSFASALARQGALCEAGYELQDGVTRAYQVLFGGERGKLLNPVPLRIVIAIHFTMGLSMVVPMNLVYPDLGYYHELVFLLQFAAFAALTMQSYGFTLDIKTASGLNMMKILVTITVAVIAYGRGFRFIFVAYKLIMQIYGDGYMKMLCTGGFAIALMSLLNLLMVVDSIAKFAKFIGMKHEDEDLHDEIAMMHNSFHRHSTHMIMTKSHKEWSKVRGAVHLGAFRNLNKEKEAAKDKTKALLGS